MTEQGFELEEPEGNSPRPGVWRGPALVLVFVLAAASLIVWFGFQRETPSIVAQRFCSALKGHRWSEAYSQIDWPDGTRMDEKTFTQTAKALSVVYTIQKYSLGRVRRDGDAAIVPIQLTVSASSLTGSKEVTDDVDLRCRFVDGKWKVRPDFKQGFLGLGKLNLPGLK